MILTAPRDTIEQQAIHTLVNDVYVDSRSILSFPHYRARKVHLAVVNRCLKQLSSAAAKLKAFSDGTMSGDDEPMIIVASEQQEHEQELLFIRSLAVLRELHRLHQVKAHFAAPDLRSLILDSPKDIEGDSAELKYQSFDGDTQTEVMPLNIGKRNTAASLLASLRDATGFTNYRIYYRGRPFVPQESEICKSLEDLQIHNGIILVKRESDVVSSPTRVRPGASPVETEILGHFDELWGYLSMEEKLAKEIYSFLVKLPPDDNILRVLKSPGTPCIDLFPLAHPYKSLYAIHALRDFLGSERKAAALSVDGRSDDIDDESPTQYPGVLTRCMEIVVAAISDPDLISRCPNPELQTELSSALVECLVRILQDPLLPEPASQYLDASLLDRLIWILSSSRSIANPSTATTNISLTLRSIFECCSRSTSFWAAFRTHLAIQGLMADLLLNDPRSTVRQQAAILISERIAHPPSPDATAEDLHDFLWPIVSGLIGPAVSVPQNSHEVLGLSLSILKLLRASKSAILDIRQLLADWGDLLLSYTSYEVKFNGTAYPIHDLTRYDRT
jgi:ubiquitin carboxyl-terminal hydrolase 34